MTNYIERYWRDATPEDAIKDPPMVARFRDPNYSWKIEALRGIRQGAAFPWFSESKISFQQCQVYDAPDPGEGWRLIDPEKDDYNQDGVEYWCIGRKRWLPRFLHNDKAPFLQDGFYRIRIEPPKPKYVPFTWEDREQLRGRWITREKDGYVIEEIAYRFDSRAFEVVAKNLLQDWRFLDTGEPVGKRVQ